MNDEILAKLNRVRAGLDNLSKRLAREAKSKDAERDAARAARIDKMTVGEMDLECRLWDAEREAERLGMPRPTTKADIERVERAVTARRAR